MHYDKKDKQFNWNIDKPMKVLDLFCCSGGGAVGYERAFGNVEITGIDIVTKKEYPYNFIKADIIDFIQETPIGWFQQFDLIHASPPCQYHSRTKHLAIAQGNDPSDVDLMPLIRFFLMNVGVPYVIENVVEAWMIPWENSGRKGKNPKMVNTILCGSSFGLGVQRHRMFESSFPIESLLCNHETESWPIGPKGKPKPWGIYGSLGDHVKGTCSKTGRAVEGGWTPPNILVAKKAMGIKHITQWTNLKEAIPPAYTEHIGKCFLKHKEGRIKAGTMRFETLRKIKHLYGSHDS
jgi:DNA (cytosine-5)-methyltransferase 1|tara:strand:- start:2200 stop:3078 length:879 start_codon:yes stop_codon:yes gene_type:complete